MTKASYISISPGMLRPDTKSPFDTFLRRNRNYVLFNAGGGIFTEAKRQELVNNNIDNLYIDSAALNAYRDYLQDNIADVLTDECIPLDERAEAWTGTALHLGKGVFEKNLPGPALKQRFQRFERLLKNSTQFLKSPRALKQLARFISKGYDDYRHGISTMVYTVSLMQEFDYNDGKVLACGMGALLHDIGKTSLPAEILAKDPNLLTDEERDTLHLHPMVGARICSHFNVSSTTSNAILFHHEREDGTGYPTRATGDQIPTHAKILRLCDVYDNLTRPQPWRKQFTPFEALKNIMEDEGLVNKDLLKKFIEMLARAEIV